MKKILLFFSCLLVIIPLYSQSENQYSVKLEGISGNILPHDKHVKDLILQPVTGAELSLELQTMGSNQWHQYLGFPIVGVGAVWLNLGNPAELGDAFALYPYLNFPLLHNRFIRLGIKGGAGASYLTKDYYNTNTDNTLKTGNTAVGSHLNVYFSGGGTFEVAVYKGISLTAEYTWNHMSNGSAVAPNTGLNLMNSFVGIKYYPNHTTDKTPVKKNLPDITRHLTFEVIASGGFRQLYYMDDKTFPIASLVLSVYKPISNFYRIGLGVDGFYDGAYGFHNTEFERTYITTDEFENKIRVGLSLRNEMLVGRLTAGIDLGLYVYNPLKNLSPYEDAKNGTLNKPLIYSYNIDEEDGWFYTRATLKYMLDKHLFISLGLKTHLQKAEFIEWGLGYRF